MYKCYKRLMVITLSVLTAMGLLTGCISGEGATKSAVKAPYTVEIDKVFISDSWEGEILVANLAVENLSDEYIDAGRISFDISAKRGDDTLENTFVDRSNPEYINDQARIAAGEKGKAQAAFTLGDDAELKGEVKLLGLTYAVKSGEQVEVLKETIELSEIEKLESENIYALTIDNVVKSDDGEGNEIVIIDATFTNNSENAVSFGSALQFDIFQNGTALKQGYLPYKHPARNQELEENSYLDIQKDVSIKVQKVFNLNDSSALIEVKVTDPMSYNQAVILEKEIQLQ